MTYSGANKASGHLQPRGKNSRANTYFAQYEASLLGFSFSCDTIQTYSLLFFLLFSVQYFSHIFRFIKEWRKNPQWSVSCCLALLLPLDDLQSEITGITGENLLKQQVQTGNIDMPSVSSTLNESGAVSFDLAAIRQQAEGPVNVGFDGVNGGLEEEDADKVAFVTRKKLDHLANTATFDTYF